MLKKGLSLLVSSKLLHSEMKGMYCIQLVDMLHKENSLGDGKGRRRSIGMGVYWKGCINYLANVRLEL